MDLRAKVKGIMVRWGHDILLQRKNDCEFSNKLERHTVRYRWPNQNGGLAGTTNEVPEGIISEVDMIYYFMWDANPGVGDRIYDQNPTGRLRYTIDWALPLRFNNGRIEYWTVGVTLEEGPY